MDFQGLFNEVTRRLHADTTNAGYLTAVKAWVNLGRSQIIAYLPGADFLQTVSTIALVAPTSQYSLSTNLVKLNPEEVRLGTSRTRLTHLSPKNEGYLSSLSTAGTPTNFRMAGYRTIQLLPPPNAAAVTAETNFDYEYSRNFADMTANGDAHSFPLHLEPAIVDMAECYGWMYLRRYELASFAWQRAIATLQAYDPGSEFLKTLSISLAPPANRVPETTPPQIVGVT